MTAPDARSPSSSDGAAQVIGASTAVRFVESILSVIRRAAFTSAAGAQFRRAARAWTAEPLTQRRLALGLMLIVGVIVHLAMSLWQGPPPGWLWLVPPGLAAAIAVLFVAASGKPGGERA